MPLFKRSPDVLHSTLQTLDRAVAHPYLALVIALLGVALALSGKLSVGATQVCIGIALVAGIVGLRWLPLPALLGVGLIMSGAAILLAYYLRPALLPQFFGTLSAPEVVLSAGQGALNPDIEIGDSGTVFLWRGKEGEPMFRFIESSELKIETIDGSLKVSTQVRDRTGALVATLERNEWRVAPSPQTWDRNYTENALEVIDNRGRVVLQIRLLPDRVKLQAEWRFPNGHGLRFVDPRRQDRGGAIVVITPIFDPDEPSIKPMFRYPSQQHFGELIQ